jgi:hypothetical protein
MQLGYWLVIFCSKLGTQEYRVDRDIGEGVILLCHILNMVVSFCSDAQALFCKQEV